MPCKSHHHDHVKVLIVLFLFSFFLAVILVVVITKAFIGKTISLYLRTSVSPFLFQVLMSLLPRCSLFIGKHSLDRMLCLVIYCPCPKLSCLLGKHLHWRTFTWSRVVYFLLCPIPCCLHYLGIFCVSLRNFT